MNARPRPTPAEFVYGDEQWMRMRAIVERAGGVVARDKFDAQRTILEKTVEGWKWKIGNWDGRTLGQDDSAIYRRVESAARELNGALAALTFPAIFIGHDLVWKSLAETYENERRYSDFCAALEHIRARAAKLMAPKRKRILYARDRLFVDLWRVWRGGLDLAVSSDSLSPVVEFIATAAEGIVPEENRTLDMISNVIRKGPRHAGL
jgi:hypothetical protein